MRDHSYYTLPPVEQLGTPSTVHYFKYTRLSPAREFQFPSWTTTIQLGPKYSLRKKIRWKNEEVYAMTQSSKRVLLLASTPLAYESMPQPQKSVVGCHTCRLHGSPCLVVPGTVLVASASALQACSCFVFRVSHQYKLPSTINTDPSNINCCTGKASCILSV